MVYLHHSLAAWDKPEFTQVCKQEVESLAGYQLPLQSALSHSSQVSDSGFELLVQSVTSTEQTIQVKAGVFFSGIVAGCNCADDPSPIDEQTEYCVMSILIDRSSAAAEFILLAE